MQMFTGTVKNAVKMQFMNSKLNEKSKSGELFTKKERNERANMSKEERMIDNFKNQMAQKKEAEKKTDLSYKIMSGGTLTSDEIRYLEQNDPAMLAKYRQTKMEKKAYEEKLRKCKTKDEVDRLKSETVGGYLAQLKKVVNNPCIPKSEKLAIAQEMVAKTNNIAAAEEKFKQTAQYAALPTEAEIAEEKAKEEAKEQEKIVEQLKEFSEEETEKSKGETAETMETPVVEKTEKEETAVEKTEKGEPGVEKPETLEPDNAIEKKKKAGKKDPKKELEEILEQISLQVQLDEGANLKVDTREP